MNSLTKSAGPAYLGSLSAAAPFVHSIVGVDKGLFPCSDIVKLLNGPTITTQVRDSLGVKLRFKLDSLVIANIH